MRYEGATRFDTLTALACVCALIAMTIAVAEPAHRFAVHEDAARTDDVRNLMEALLEMQTVDPARIDALRKSADASGAPPRVLLGTGASCAGDWGAQCGDALVADDCLDIGEFAHDYLRATPVDSAAMYSQEATGYYLDFSPGVLEVGACNPETQQTIRLARTFF